MIATTRGALMRGTTTENALGDEVQDDSIPEPTYSEWAEADRNYILDPSMQNQASAYWGQFGAVASTLSRTTVATPSGDGGCRQTFATITGSWSIALYGSRNTAGMPIGVLGEKWVVGIRARASKAGTLNIGLCYGSGSAVTATAAVALTTDETDYFVELIVGAAAVGQILSIRLGLLQAGNPGWIVGDWVEYSRPVLARSTPAPRFYTGDDGDGAIERFSWAVNPYTSNSIRETREVIDGGGREGFPLSLILKNERTFDQASGEWRTVEYYAGRVPSYVDVDEGDRVKDLRDGAIYTVDEFTRIARGLSGRSSVTLKMRRTAP